MPKNESSIIHAVFIAALGAGTACVGIAGFATTAQATESRIEAVTLLSGGLAEIHRSARIEGTEELRFDVPLEQVDDILKSLVVRDAAGTVTAMTLDGLSPVEETFRRLPFSPNDMASLPALLGSLQGIRVRASSGGRTVEGVVLGVEARQHDADGSPRDERYLSVLTDELQITVLRLGTDAELDILDETMLERIRDASEVSGRSRADDVRTITVALAGEDERTVSVSYVVAAPVWKTAYRLVVDADEQARLQAWAVIENASGEDWENVDIALSSGAPVTLTQRLHQRYWHDRDELPVFAQTASPPRPDGSAAIYDDAGILGEASAMRLQAAPAEAMAFAEQAAPSRPTLEAAATEGETAATYRLPAPIDLPAGQTLSVPFIDSDLPAERIALFQGERNDIHPVATIMLENGTGAHLPPGILTVYDGQEGYLGDAQLLNVPVGESRMVSFATDRKVEVTTEAQPQESVTRATLVDGVLRTTRTTRAATHYTVKGAPDAPRTVIIEHPRRDGWQISSDALESSTPTHHRLRAVVEQGATAEVTAIAQRTDAQTFALVDIDADALLRWSGAIDDPQAAARLTELAELRRQVARTEAELREIDHALERAAESQARIRDNLAAVPGDSALGQRYVSMLEDEEDSIAELNERRQTVRDRLTDRREAVATFIREL